MLKFKNHTFIRATLWLFLWLAFLSSQVEAQDTSKIEKHFDWEKLELPVPPGREIQPGLAGAFSGLSNHVLIIAGGANFPDNPPWEGGEKVWHDDVYVLSRQGSENEWVNLGEFTLDKPVAYGVSITTPQGLLCIGGNNSNGIISDIFLLSWDLKTKEVSYKKVGALPESFEATGGALIDNHIYVTGIVNDRNHFINIELNKLFQGANNEISWHPLPACPGPPRRMASYAAQSNGEDNCFYSFSGRSESDGEVSLLTDAYLFNTKAGKWEKIKGIFTNDIGGINTMGAPAMAYGANTVFIFGGDDGRQFLERSKLEQAIAAASNQTVKDSLQRLLKQAFLSHQGFKKAILHYNTITNTFSRIGTLPEQAPVVTNAVLWDDKIFLPSGEIKPGVRSPHVVVGSPIKETGTFGFLNYTVLAIYFVVLLLIGFYFSSKQKSTDDYFKGGGRVPWWAAGLSVFGTALSAITFMAIPAKTFATDWSYFFYNLSILLATPVVVIFFIPFFRRLNVTTAYDFLEQRFNLAVRLFGSLSFIIFQIGRIAIVLYLPAIALSLVTGIDIYFCIITMGVISMIYTLIGGIEAVIWTDVVQVIVLMGGALLSLFLIVFNVEGGFSTMLETASNHEKFNLANFDFQFSEPTFWVVIIGGFFANLVTYSSDQTMVQRYLTTVDEKGAAKTAWTNALLVIPATLLFFGVGTALYLYYLEFPQKLDPFAKDTDAIFPWYIISNLPNGVSGLLIAGVFSAAMSSLSSSMNSIANAFTSDFYHRFKRKANGRELLNVAKFATLLCGVLGVLFALWMATSDIVSLWDMFFKVLGLFTGGLGGLFFLGIISKQANGAGAIVGLIVSSIGQYLIATYTDLHMFLYAATGFLVCVIVGHLASLIIPDHSNEKGKQLTIYNKLFRK